MPRVPQSVRPGILLLCLAATVLCVATSARAECEERAGAKDRAPDQRRVLMLAASHVERYAAELPYLVGEETTTQRMTPRPGRGGEPATRRLVSDFGWAQLDGITEPLGLREVQSVDWEPVRPVARLAPLLNGSRRGSTAEARALLNAGARYNLAPGSRNFNLPTFVFFFLLPDWQPRFSWKLESPPGAATWEFSFKERERPTVIRSESRKPVFSRGRVWVDAETGAVVRTLLETTFEKNSYRLEVQFAKMSEVGLTLPASMVETFGADTFIVEGRATYREYRRFTTEARLVERD